jgi:ribulose-5-phosphate 4-epimerase/fuculose-1-phosphate aldolase
VFTPTPGKLVPDLSPRAELALLARTLWHEGYCDHLAGHITHNLGDGTFLCNPSRIAWDELVPSQVLHIDCDGQLLAGDWPEPRGIRLHLELHKARAGIAWVMHNHPLFGTVWSDIGTVPPVMDQNSAAGGGDLVLVDEFEGEVSDTASATSAVDKIGMSELVLLRGHGVVVLGRSARTVFQRAVALEMRCRNAWYVQAAVGRLESPLPETWVARVRAGDAGGTLVGREEGPPGYWEASIRRELGKMPELLEA